MVIPSTPPAPPLAFTRSHACCRFSGQRIRSNRSSEGVPCSCSALRCVETRPLGVIVSSKAGAVEPQLTSLGLREGPTSLLCPRLTPVPPQGPVLAPAPAVADGLGLQASLSKDVNSCCTTGPFISGAEHGAAPCGACSPTPSTLYGLSVRRLISFDRWLPSHETSRSRSCFGLVLGPNWLPL
jgi:hypothetical protein